MASVTSSPYLLCSESEKNSIVYGHHLRSDIQLLRGVAIFAVLLYHANKFLLAGGFLGVDIFFVLSGYLITRIIYRDISNGVFSYWHFIAKRFQRLLPACYAMLLFSTFLAFSLLTTQEMSDYLKQLLGTLTFSSNFILLQQSGYFDTASSLKLLLHTWSLSLEEQYYLFLPFAIYIALRGNLVKGVLGFFFLSLVLCFFLISSKPSVVFYLLPFRSWELLAGSLAAILVVQGKAPVVPSAVKVLAIALVFAMLVCPLGSPHPGLSALIVVICTSVLMVSPVNFGFSLLSRTMYYLGDISYSVYLFHWPMFAVANHVYAQQMPLIVTVALVVASLILGALSYNFVERPFRSKTVLNVKKVIFISVVSGVLIALISYGLYTIKHSKSNDGIGSVPNYGLSNACNFQGKFVELLQCKSTKQLPTVMLWGDSYAMHLADALMQQHSFTFIQATKSFCGPVIGVSPLMGGYNKTWARNCQSFNQSTLDFLLKHDEIRLVILGSMWRQYFNLSGVEGYLATNPTMNDMTFSKTIEAHLIASKVRDLILTITQSGRKVLFVSPPPSAEFDVYQCYQRKAQHLPYIGATERCQIGIDGYKKRNLGYQNVFAASKLISGVYEFSFEGLLCNKGECKTKLNDVELYRDNGHFSPVGSAYLGEKSGINAYISNLLIAD